MKGDFTRFTFDPTKNYNRVLKQQGRADLDADFNESVDIAEHLTRERATDVIGSAGVPKGESFRINVTPDSSDLTISPGHVYVNGILCQLLGDLPISFKTGQPDFKPPGALNPVANRTDLVFIDVWERHITAIEDGDIREVALGGVDTATRVKTIWQVKVQPGVGATKCADAISNWPPLPGSGSLTTMTASGGGDEGPCVLPAAGGYRGLENRLYRVEIHEGGNLSSTTFKWSRDNGTVVFPCEFLPNETRRIKLRRQFRDAVLSLKAGDKVEVQGDETELQGNSGTLATVLDVSPDLVVFLDTDVDSHRLEGHPKIRRWDGVEGTDGGAVKTLEDGIQIRFSGGIFSTADYWVFTARVGNAGLEALTDAPPRGVRHHYAKLALVLWQQAGSVLQGVVEDCRDQFPPLTEICAEDVCYHNEACQMPDVSTVQQAIDFLCQQSHECCSIMLAPDEDWVLKLQQIQAPGANVCFRPGVFNVTQPIVMKGKLALKFTGSGRATRLVAARGSSVLQFEESASVSISDLSVETGVVGTSSGALVSKNAGLVFQGCQDIKLSSVNISCPNGTRRTAACVRVSNAVSVSIKDSSFTVGTQQTGVQLVDVQSVRFTNNVLTGNVTQSLVFGERLRLDTVFRAGIRSTFLSNLAVNPDPADRRTFNVHLDIGGNQVRFNTPKHLANLWESVLKTGPLPPFRSTRQVSDYVYTATDKLLLAGGQLSNAALPFRDFLRELAVSPNAAAQGLVIGGVISEDVVVTGNRIVNFMQGIHAGLSKLGMPRTAAGARLLNRVIIHDNWIKIRLVPGPTRARHGIFIGNCLSLVIRNNYAELIRSSARLKQDVEGIRVFGYFGRQLLIRENHLTDFSTGIVLERRGALPAR